MWQELPSGDTFDFDITGFPEVERVQMVFRGSPRQEREQMVLMGS